MLSPWVWRYKTILNILEKKKDARKDGGMFVFHKRQFHASASSLWNSSTCFKITNESTYNINTTVMADTRDGQAAMYKK